MPILPPVDIRSIHHHFPGKADLVKAVVEEYRAEAQAGMQAMDEQINDPLNEVKAYVDYWAHCIKEGLRLSASAQCWRRKCPLPPDVATEVSGHFSDLRLVSAPASKAPPAAFSSSATAPKTKPKR